MTPTWITLRDAQFDNEEGEKRTEEEVSDWEKVAGPDLLSISV